MIVLPAIDILDGCAVRLKQGDYEAVTVYNTDPVAQAAEFVEAGAQWLHIVDLDGARTGTMRNIDIIRAIIETTGLMVEVGGGVRTLEGIAALMDAGVVRCVLGTKLATDAEFVRAAVAEYGAFVAAGIDARDGKVAIEGWREGTDVPALELVSELTDLGIRHLVYTDISRDGMGSGIDVEDYREVARVAGFPVVASGGVSGLADIANLAALGADVVEGVVVGRALYERAFALDEAIATASGVDLRQMRALLAELEAAGDDAGDFPFFTEVEE